MTTHRVRACDLEVGMRVRLWSMDVTNWGVVVRSRPSYGGSCRTVAVRMRGRDKNQPTIFETDWHSETTFEVRP